MKEKILDKSIKIGFIGIGDMGKPMVLNLVASEYKVQIFDIKQDAMEECLEAGAKQSGSVLELLQENDIICTALPSCESYLRLAKNELIPNARPGQIFIEFGTTIPEEIKRLYKLFTDAGSTLLDVPVSGGPIGVTKKSLKMFAGGDLEHYETCIPIFSAIGGPSKIFYCGLTGTGQAMKGVNQLAMGLISAALLESVTFGIRAGLDPSTISQVYHEERMGSLSGIANKIKNGEGNDIGVKFRELPYYIKEVAFQGYDLPLTDTLFNFCDKGERVAVDDHRMAPSFYNELLKKK